MIQLSTGKQYAGDSYFRGQDFIQTNLHSTFPQILMPVSSTLASQEFSQAFPKPHSPCNSSQLIRGGPAEPLLVQVQSCGSPATPSGHQKKGHALKRRLPLCQSLGTVPESAGSPVFRGRARFWVSALGLYTWW
jgi:hypothetical protein